MADSVFDLLQNFTAANSALNMSPQEQALYKRHIGNLWGAGGVDNPDGSRSTLYQMSTTGPDGQTYNMPTVYDGQKLSPDAAYARGMQQGLGAFPAYPSPDAAESRYNAMHQFMDKDTSAYMDVRRNPLMLFGSMLPAFTNR
jgi:hypothetical protein